MLSCNQYNEPKNWYIHMFRSVRISEDYAWIADLLQEHWGSTTIVSRGKSQDASKLPAFIALFNGERVGLLTYHIGGTDF